MPGPITKEPGGLYVLTVAFDIYKASKLGASSTENCSLYKPVIHLPHENCKLSKYLFYELSRLKHYRREHPRNIWGRELRLMHCRSTAKPAKLNGKLGWPSDWTRHSIPKAKEDPQLSLMLLRDQGHWTSDLWIWQRGAREGTRKECGTGLFE